MNREHQLDSVADRLRDVATLVGKQENKEITLASGQTVVPGLGMIERATALNERADRLENGSLRLAVVGCSVQGKSTLVNALLGENLLPARREPTTAVITEIVYGNSEKEVRLVEKDGSERTIPRKVFTEKCVLEGLDRETPDAFKNIAHAVLESNCSLCEKGLHIIDTPGLYAATETEIINPSYLKQVDSVLIVFDKNTHFNNTNMALINSIKRIPGSELNHAFFLINKRNLDDDGTMETLVTYTRKRLNEFDEARFGDHVFVVDVQAALDAKCNENSTIDLEGTGLPAFEQRITQLLGSDERADVILDAAVCDVLIPNLAAASAYIKKHTAQDSIENKLPRLKQEANDIQHIFANFRNEVANSVANDLISYLTEFFGESNTEWQAIEPKKKKKELAKQVIEYIKENIPDLRERVFDSVKEKMENSSEELKEKIATFIREVSTPEASVLISELYNTLDENNQRIINRLHSEIHELLSEISKSINESVLSEIGINSKKNQQNTMPGMGKRQTRIEKAEKNVAKKNEKKERLISVREHLQKGVQENAAVWKDHIRESISNKGKSSGEKASELQAALKAEIGRLQEQSDATTIEKKRLKTINDLLTQELEAICQTAYGRVLTYQEQEQERFLKNRG